MVGMATVVQQLTLLPGVVTYHHLLELIETGEGMPMLLVAFS